MGSTHLKAEKTVYYYIGEKLGKFEVMHTIFMNDSTDKHRIEDKNVFINSFDAQKFLDKINNIFKGNK